LAFRHSRIASERARVVAAAEAAGTSPHSIMGQAIARETDRAEQYDAFLDDAVKAEVVARVDFSRAAFGDFDQRELGYP
jgi:hypothetical protein